MIVVMMLVGDITNSSGYPTATDGDMTINSKCQQWMIDSDGDDMIVISNG